MLGPPTNGISLGPLSHETGAAGFADGSATYIVRYAPDSTISLVDSSTVVAGAQALAEGLRRSVRPLGFTKLGVPAADQPGAAAVSRGALWLLAQQGSKCDLLRVRPAAQVGQGLSVGSRAKLPTGCADAALEASPTTVGLALPGEVQLLQGNGHEESCRRRRDSARNPVLTRARGSGRALVPGENVVGVVGVRSWPRRSGIWPRGPEGIRPGRRAGCAGLLGR